MSIPTTSTYAIATPLPVGSVRQPGLIPGGWLALGFGLSVLCVAALLYDDGITIDPWAPSTLLFGFAFAFLAAVRFVTRDPSTNSQRIARDLAESVGLFMGVGLLGAVATYPLAADTRGSVDAVLQHIDEALHFNWLAWYELVVAHRSLQILGTAAYQSIFVTPALILGHYAFADKRAEARGFLVGFWIAAVISLAIFRYIPALGPLATLWHGPVPYLPESGLYEADLLPALRSHMLREVDLGTLRGLVSAPSFHTASAVLYMAAGWRIARLRWTVMVLNGAMLLSTPIEGTHYLADMIAGAAVAIVALILMRTLRRTMAARGRERV
ncbi:phosphatase PAP2 family protein [Sphingomonas glacialis]|uniref:PAP2 family protein n=1 Tax=Sphingomonas glacialis TaxID=658225 RepID=A0A502FI31_9SPHN|nr:phosphatase PAP2 family protein [Sphingomonas glacialis]TPG49029.1 PAP2 family protein [Sphingomonas glacialis]